MSQIVHAGLIALRCGGDWRGALIEGPSGIGKSDLALRAIAMGFRLVADDRTRLWACAGALFGCSPAPIAGLIEARGLGVLAGPSLPFARVRLIALCCEPDADLDRIPEPAAHVVAGIAIPVMRLRPLEASAPVKLHRLLSLLGASS